MIRKFKNWFYHLAATIVKDRIVNSENSLTPQYLEARGWVREDYPTLGRSFWIESNIKDRDKIWIEFESRCYRVWHGRDRTFIALGCSREWFDLYYFLHDKFQTKK